MPELTWRETFGIVLVKSAKYMTFLSCGSREISGRDIRRKRKSGLGPERVRLVCGSEIGIQAHGRNGVW